MIEIPESGYYLGMSGVGGKPDSCPAEAIFLNQVHGTEIVRNPSGSETADGMILNRGAGIPALKVADCLPVFALWDSCVAAVHVGWRGLAEGVTEKLFLSVEQPLRWLVLGPCICGKCYTVGEEVIKAVARSDPGGEASHPSGRVDLRGSVLRRVRQVAGDGFRLINLSDCTMESACFYSFRSNKTHRRNLLWLAETAGR